MLFLRHSVVINFLPPPEPDHNMPHLSPSHWPVLNSTKMSKLCGNGQIPRLSSKFHVPWKTVVLTMRIITYSILVTKTTAISGSFRWTENGGQYPALQNGQQSITTKRHYI